MIHKAPNLYDFVSNNPMNFTEPFSEERGTIGRHGSLSGRLGGTDLESHHIGQDAMNKTVRGGAYNSYYNSNDAPAVALTEPEHRAISNLQSTAEAELRNQGRTLQELSSAERRALTERLYRDAGLEDDLVRRMMNAYDDYFGPLKDKIDEAAKAARAAAQEAIQAAKAGKAAKAEKLAKSAGLTKCFIKRVLPGLALLVSGYVICQAAKNGDYVVAAVEAAKLVIGFHPVGALAVAGWEGLNLLADYCALSACGVPNDGEPEAPEKPDPPQLPSTPSSGAWNGEREPGTDPPSGPPGSPTENIRDMLERSKAERR